MGGRALAVGHGQVEDRYDDQFQGHQVAVERLRAPHVGRVSASDRRRLPASSAPVAVGPAASPRVGSQPSAAGGRGVGARSSVAGQRRRVVALRPCSSPLPARRLRRSLASRPRVGAAGPPAPGHLSRLVADWSRSGGSARRSGRGRRWFSSSQGRMFTTLRRGRPCSTSASTGRSRGGSPEVVMMMAGSSRSLPNTCCRPKAIPVRTAPVALRLRHASTLAGRADWTGPVVGRGESPRASLGRRRSQVGRARHGRVIVVGPASGSSVVIARARPPRRRIRASRHLVPRHPR